MSEHDKFYDPQIEESIRIVKCGQRLPRKECHFVPEQEYRRLKKLERDAAVAEQQEQTVKLHGCLMAVLRLCNGLIFAGAGAEGLMDPIFAGIATVGCVFWAAFGIKWRWRHA